MKKNFKQTAAVFLAIVFACASCKKDDGDPTPKPTPVNPPAVNQPSTTAPSLNAGTNTKLTAVTGASNAGIVNLSFAATDPQEDEWTITSVTSSNASVVTIEDVSNDEAGNGFKYTGISAGTATLTIVVADVNGNTNTFTYSITVSQPPAAPVLNAGVSTTLYVQAGSNTSWNLNGKVTDYQGDTWTIYSVTSSNTSIATVSISGTAIEYVGQDEGRATLTVTLEDEHNNRNTFNATIHVTPKPSKPIIIIEK